MAKPAVNETLRTVPVSEAMTSRVYSVTRNWSLLSTARLLRNHHISGVPVVDANDHVVGVVSESDLLTDLDRSAGIGTVRGVLDLLLTAGGYHRRDLVEQCLHRLRNTKVEKAMKSPPVVVDSDATLGEAARVLHQYHINRLPVVQEGRLVGIVTRQDIVEAMNQVAQWPKGVPVRRYSRGPPLLAEA